MKDLIFIAGAPGTGKSTVAKALQKELDSPLFEFGWIPEFRNNGTGLITYEEEEALSFENLVLVVKNYVKHDFKNTIVTDLNNDFIESLPEIFNDYDFVIYTLCIQDEAILKSRVLDDSRSSGYRNWQEAIAINRKLQNRSAIENEIFLQIDNRTADEISTQILTSL